MNSLGGAQAWDSSLRRLIRQRIRYEPKRIVAVDDRYQPLNVNRCKTVRYILCIRCVFVPRVDRIERSFPPLLDPCDLVPRRDGSRQWSTIEFAGYPSKTFEKPIENCSRSTLIGLRRGNRSRV